MELNGNGIDYKGEETVIKAFREHFSQLATLRQQNNIDLDYHKQAEDDSISIDNLVEHKHITEVQPNEIAKAIRSINKGKSADYYGLTIEHIIFAGSEMEELLRTMINNIFMNGKIPETLKMGLLRPVFKNKGTKQQAIYYRGITVLPVISKIIETIIKQRTTNIILKTQNKSQRGFTIGVSPMN